MRYRALDDELDMTFGRGGNNFLINSPEAVAQSVLTRLKLWRGEWFLDVTEGTPYQQGVLGTGKREKVEPAIRQRILEGQGVKALTAFDISIDPDERTVSINATIDTIYGEAELNGII